MLEFCVPSEYLTEPFWRAPTHRIGRGDDTAEAVYTASGKALSHWEMFETEVAILFAVLVEGRTKAAFRAYGKLASSSARRDALEEVSRIFFGSRSSGSGGIPKAIRDLISVLAWAGARRNEIAHGTVTLLGLHKTHGYFLTSSQYNSRKNRPFQVLNAEDELSLLSGTYAYSSSEIDEMCDRFIVCISSVDTYLAELVATYGLPHPEF